MKPCRGLVARRITQPLRIGGGSCQALSNTYVSADDRLPGLRRAGVGDSDLSLFPLIGLVPLLPWAAALVVLGFWARQRGCVAERAFERSLFHGRPLTAMQTQVDHVLCATDFQTAEPVYFSGRFLYSYRLGWGRPADLHVARAVQGRRRCLEPSTPAGLAQLRTASSDRRLCRGCC
jgi:hypothetical protein